MGEHEWQEETAWLDDRNAGFHGECRKRNAALEEQLAEARRAQERLSGDLAEVRAENRRLLRLITDAHNALAAALLARAEEGRSDG